MKQSIDFDALGDELKAIELSGEGKLLPGIPVYARLDGKKFSRFTRGMKKPYDHDMIDAMKKLTVYLVEETSADLGFCQSDEISLYWSGTKKQSEMLFGGRHTKMLGELVGLATSKMTRLTMEKWPDRIERAPRFDCRLFNVSKEDAAKFFLWRQMDCTKNSISMVAQSHFSHKSLDKISTKKRLELLKEKGINWFDELEEFRYGIFVRRTSMEVAVNKSEIPEHVWPTLPDFVTRRIVQPVVLDKIQNMELVTDVLDNSDHYIKKVLG